MKLAVASFVVIGVVFYVAKIGEDYSREMLLTTYGVYFVVSVLLKALYKKARLSYWARRPEESMRRFVVVTTSHDAKPVEKLVYAEDVHSNEVVGFCLVDSFAAGELHGKPTVPTSELSFLVQTLCVDEVLVTVDPALVGDGSCEKLVEDGVCVSFSLVDALGLEAESVSLRNVGVFKTVRLERYTFGATQLLYLPVKRVFDILLGILGCIFAIFVAAFVKLGYLATGDRHPIVYQQERIGRRGVPFRMYKFRTMVWNADEELERLLQDPELQAEWEREQKLESDPRVTGVGRVLRRTSLDESPQFLNVLVGDMSVVGPRPLVPGELEEHGGRSLYQKVKPGITGWWGCNGRSNIDYRERLELEYHYVRHCSLYLDVVCILRTVAAVAKRDGAI